MTFPKIDEFANNAFPFRGESPLDMFYNDIKESLETTGKVPVDLEDIITVSVINANGKTRAIINWA